MMPPSVAAMKVDTFPTIRDVRGALTVAELDSFVPFKVVRLFFMTGVPAGTVRGQHGHYHCSQYFLCQGGRLQTILSDGVQERIVILELGQGILIPPGIFASQTYLEQNTILQVLCDRPYEKEDYIHSLNELRAWRAGA
jgi:dTDP-4-dehydrorhamnose 3,5-epimerase-like enzyme